MKPEIKETIYSQLKGAQEKYGGYTGKDIAILSRKINRKPGTVRRQIEKYRMQDNCLMLKSLLLEELNK
jgi:hypothetical protein